MDLFLLERQLIYAKANKEHLECLLLFIKIKRLKRKEKI